MYIRHIGRNIAECLEKLDGWYLTQGNVVFGNENNENCQTICSSFFDTTTYIASMCWLRRSRINSSAIQDASLYDS